jgi:hypothetical protein
MKQIDINRGGILATAGFSLLSDTNVRTNIMHPTNLPIHIPAEVLSNNFVPTKGHENF